MSQTDLRQSETDFDSSAFAEGDHVRIEYDPDYNPFGRGTLEIEGEVVVDRFLHRDTPEGDLDVEIAGDDGSFTARLTQTDHRVLVKSLHYATPRHDHHKGTLVSIERLAGGEER